MSFIFKYFIELVFIVVFIVAVRKLAIVQTVNSFKWISLIISDKKCRYH